jgi:uncharacterized protein (DUF983 family)
LSLLQDLTFALKPRCPKCRRGSLFKPWSVTVVKKCAECGFYLGKHDVGDGASVFLIFLLGFSIVPMAWFFELAFAPPLWVHAVLWGAVALGMVALILPTVKAFIILLEYRHR